MQSGDRGLALRRQRCDYQRRTAAQVGAFHGGTGQRRHALYHRHAPFDLDVCAEAQQLADIAIAVVKDRFDENARPRGKAGSGKKRRSRVGGKARVGHGADELHGAQPRGRGDGKAVRRLLDETAAEKHF